MGRAPHRFANCRDGRECPLRVVELNRTVEVAEGADRVSIHLNDRQGVDHGSLGEAKITKVETTS